MKTFRILKNIFKISAITIFALFAVFCYSVFVPESKLAQNVAPIISNLRPYPTATAPKDITLSCDYHGKTYAVTETLYSSLNDFYGTDPKKTISYMTNDNKSFVFSYEKDKTLDGITAKIKNIATTNGLNEDQTLDLAGCMIQNIPYDTEKAQKILSPDFSKIPTEQVIPRYPYETLFDGKGVCSDKSYLGTAIFSRLGYGTSLLLFNAQKHMSIGVSTPAGFRSFDTDYGIYELTGQGFMVGDVPDILGNSGLAKSNFEVKTGDTNVSASSLTKPSEITKISDGRVYERIVARSEMKARLDRLSAEIIAEKAQVDSAQKNLVSVEADLKQKENSYKGHSTNASYATYSATYNNYLVVYNNTNNLIADFNRKVDSYNRLLAEYKGY